MDLLESNILGDGVGKHWYYRSKALAIERLLHRGTPVCRVRSILDVGAGSGFFSRHLLEHSDAEIAVCVDPSYAEDTDETIQGGKHLLRRRSADSSDADLVLLMDVLEHVEDDIGLLKAYVDMCPPGSRFLITVPAFQWLWSSHDDFLGHRRRYTVTRLERLVHDVGLRLDTCHYFFALVLPLALPGRLAERFWPRADPPKSALRAHHPIIDALLGAACTIESRWMHLNRLAGLSVLCLAHRAP